MTRWPTARNWFPINCKLLTIFNLIDGNREVFPIHIFIFQSSLISNLFHRPHITSNEQRNWHFCTIVCEVKVAIDPTPYGILRTLPSSPVMVWRLSFHSSILNRKYKRISSQSIFGDCKWVNSPQIFNVFRRRRCSNKECSKVQISVTKPESENNFSGRYARWDVKHSHFVWSAMPSTPQNYEIKRI